MKQIKNLRTSLAILLTFMLLLTSFTSFAVEQNVDNEIDTVSLKEDMAHLAQSKINIEVKNALDENEYVEVLVELTEQVDTAKVAKNSVNSLTIAKAEPTHYQKKMASRHAVVDSLKTTAEKSQKGILGYLNSEKENGNVKEVRSFYIINMIYVKTKKEVVENLSYRPEIKAINLNKKIKVKWPERTETKAKVNSDDNGNIEWGIEKVGAPSVWDTYGIDGNGIVVGVIDTGTDWTHEALKEKWRGYNTEDPDNPNPAGNWFDAVDGQELPYDIPSIPHGTHVTGSILGQDPNGENIIGVAPGAKWITAKAFTEDGGEDAWLLAAGEWMLAPNGDPSLAPDIINNSWGGGSGLNEWYRPMVQAWRDAGILPVFAAGNSSTGHSPGTISAPSNYPESFAVAAIDINNKKGDFSSEGPGPYGEIKPDISAPGVNIRSSVPGGYEDDWNGTSMATPHISGVAALLLSLDASLTPDELEERMRVTAIPLTDENYPESPNYGYGIGLVNAFEAISSLVSGDGVIEGQVLTEGYDNNAPEITHEPVDFSFANFDVLVEASIKDNIAITNAEVMVKTNDSSEWVNIEMYRNSGDHKNGGYFGNIPMDLVQELGFQYKIIAQDYSGNEIETPAYNVEVSYGVKPDEYSTDFSEYPDEWEFYGEWAWGEPTVGPEVPEGEKLVATNLDGEYAPFSRNLLIAPPLDLRDADIGILHFDYWYETGDDDYCEVVVTDDFGATWNVIEQFAGIDKQWRDININLKDYVGSENQIYVGFRFNNNFFDTKLGWYIDNVEFLGRDTKAPEAPSQLEALTCPSGIKLNWNESSDEDVNVYKVYRSTTSGDGYEEIVSTDKLDYIDSNIEVGQEYFYVVTAYDFSGNESVYSTEVSMVAPEISVIYFRDFENDNGDMTVGGENITWEWGTPTTGSEGAFSGEKLWATRLNENYNNSSNSWIETPELDLSGFVSAELDFNQWVNTENNYDKCFVKVSNDNGENWTDLAMYTGNIGKWEQEYISLDDYIGQIIKIRFVLISDSSVNRPGWYIDDVNVRAVNENVEYTASKHQITVKEVQPKDTKKVESVIDFKIPRTLSNNNVIKNNNINIVSGLPVDAVITVVETGRSVRTNPEDGTFRMIHGANTEGESWTLRIEAYGYYPREEIVTLGADEELTKDIMMEAIPAGRIVGKVVDRRTGESVEGAVISVLEDSRVTSVVSDVNGDFVLNNVLEGSYTLRISAVEYHTEEISSVEIVGDEDLNLDVQLKSYIGFENEISYDDGTLENAKAHNTENSGWAVRMTPEDYGKVKGANIYLNSTNFPDPGGDTFKVGVFDSDPHGQPGEILFITDVIEGVRGEWNYVDLSELNFATDRDFYIAMIQIDPAPRCPAIAIDESGYFTGRSYAYVDGKFTHLNAEEYGNVMIRATMSYALNEPVIENISGVIYTNEDAITVSGTIDSDSLINIYVNGEVVKSVNSENNEFTAEISLAEGENIITVAAATETKETEHSQPVIVIKDTLVPELDITAPTDGFTTRERVVEVSGKANDGYLAKITINDEAIEFNGDGSFITEFIVQEGTNILNITAYDYAGNSVTVQKTVNVNKEAPTITDIKPDSNITVKAGDEVEVSFHSNAVEGTAYFRVTVPNEIKVNTTSNGILMEEVEPGYYVGTWVAPEGINLKDAIVEVEINDTVGNRATAVAEGELTIVGQNLPPINGEYVSYDRPVTIKATADGEVDWEVNIIDPNGDIVETLTDTGITYEATWGPEEAKKLNGEYTVEVNQIVEGEKISTEEFIINVYNYPIKINDIEIVEQNGYVAIEANMENLGPNVQSPMLVIQVKDEQNRVVSISTAKMEGILAGQIVKLSSGFRVPVSGTYNVEIFVWTGWYDTEALSSPETATFIIE